MPSEFTRPAQSEILQRVQSDLESEADGITARLRRRFERGLAFAIASVSHQLHGHIAWAVDQFFPDTAVERFLLRYGGQFGLTRKQAERSAGTVLVTGTGGDISVGTQWVRRGDGRLYEATEEVLAINPSASVALRAVDGGLDGDCDAGQELDLVTPIANIDGTATVEADVDGLGLTGGTDLESLADYLDRLIVYMQKPPLGGAPGDHVQWALEVPGVTRAWEYKGQDGTGNPGLGKVALAFVLDGEEDIIPVSGDVDEVQAYIDDRSPAEVIVFAPTAVPLELSIQLEPNTSAVRAAVLEEIQDLLARDAEPGGILYVSRINEAISAAVGEINHILVSPTVDQEYDFGEMPTYDAGEITFNDIP